MENKIKYYRSIKNITQEQLAKLTSCTRQTINSIEKNRYSPSLNLAFKIAEVLGVGIDELFIYKT
jgi:putative transcriptional regulator